MILNYSMDAKLAIDKEGHLNLQQSVRVSTWKLGTHIWLELWFLSFLSYWTVWLIYTWMVSSSNNHLSIVFVWMHTQDILTWNGIRPLHRCYIIRRVAFLVKPTVFPTCRSRSVNWWLLTINRHNAFLCSVTCTISRYSLNTQFSLTLR